MPIHSGLNRNPLVLAVAGVTVIGIGLAKGTLLPIGIGVAILVLAAARLLLG